MSDLEKKENGKLIQIASDIEFENDFGQYPIGLGHITKDQGVIAVCSLVGAFVGTAIAGVPLAAIVLVVGLNDILSINKTSKEQKLGEETEAIEVEAREVEAKALPEAIEVKAEVFPSPVEPAQPQTANTTSINNQQQITNHSPLPPELWTPDLMGYPSILIYGPQGAGKTSTAAWLIRKRNLAGHQIKILDPHRAYGQWAGLECIGDGMDYDAINNELQSFTEEIKVRYKTRAETPNYNPPKLTLVCDEFTQWAKKCSHSAAFFEESLTDIRKINLHVLFISHARTLTGLGGSSGLAATRDAGLLELELEAQVDPKTGEASPKLLGWLKYPGVAMNERRRVTIASWMNGSMNFTDVQQVQSEGSAGSPEPSTHPLNVTAPKSVEHLNALLNKAFSEPELSEPGNPEPLNLDPFSSEISSQERGLVVSFRRSGRSKEETIFLIWGAKKGGNKAYLAAKDKLSRILLESGLE